MLRRASFKIAREKQVLEVPLQDARLRSDRYGLRGWLVVVRCSFNKDTVFCGRESEVEVYVKVIKQ